TGLQQSCIAGANSCRTHEVRELIRVKPFAADIGLADVETSAFKEYSRIYNAVLIIADGKLNSVISVRRYWRRSDHRFKLAANVNRCLVGRKCSIVLTVPLHVHRTASRVKGTIANIKH